jgi:CRISPR/Cas system-associated endonuclease/helicase Cas3
MLVTMQFRILYLTVYCPQKVKIKMYKRIMLPVVLYACETWSLSLREEYRLRVVENRSRGYYLNVREKKSLETAQ